MKINKKIKQFSIEIIPFVFAFFLTPFIHGEIELTILIILVLNISWKIKYYKGEWKLFFTD